MYQLLKSKDNPFPTIEDTNSQFYPLYIRIGYEVIGEGTYKELEQKQLTIIEEYINKLKTN